MTRHVATWTTSFCRTPSLSESLAFPSGPGTDERIFRARRNAQGTLEPDAAEGDVQKSMGFDKFDHAPRKEERV
jgi:hypothetical protein